MKKIKIVIVDQTFSTTRSLKMYFDNHEFISIVRDFSNGEDAISYLVKESNSYDLIIMDPLLPGVDGETILEELYEKGIHKKVIIMSKFMDDNLIEHSKKYNIINFYMKPCAFNTIEKRIKDCYQTKSLIISGDKNIDLVICNVLHDLGIPSNLKGYLYIKEAILLKYTDNGNFIYITKDIYPRIASKFDTKEANVERNIRHAVEVSIRRGNYDFLSELFKNTCDINKDKPTNNEYISVIAERLMIDRNII